jgi:hypothetical protein
MAPERLRLWCPSQAAWAAWLGCPCSPCSLRGDSSQGAGGGWRGGGWGRRGAEGGSTCREPSQHPTPIRTAPPPPPLQSPSLASSLPSPPHKRPARGHWLNLHGGARGGAHSGRRGCCHGRHEGLEEGGGGSTGAEKGHEGPRRAAQALHEGGQGTPRGRPRHSTRALRGGSTRHRQGAEKGVADKGTADHTTRGMGAVDHTIVPGRAYPARAECLGVCRVATSLRRGLLQRRSSPVTLACLEGVPAAGLGGPGRAHLEPGRLTPRGWGERDAGRAGPGIPGAPARDAGGRRRRR